MKKLISLLGLLFFFFSPSTSGAQGEIQKLLKKEEIRIKKFVDNRSAKNKENYRYKIIERRIHQKDLNRDGIKDLVTEIVLCETVSCHKTTKTTFLSVFTSGKNGNKTYITSEELEGYDINVKVLTGQIRVESYEYGDSDPSCCPSKKRNDKYVLDKNLDGRIKLIKNNY